MVFTTKAVNSMQKHFLKSGADSVVTNCDYKLLLDRLDALCDVHLLDSKAATVINLLVSGPFSSIVKNEHCLLILKCLDKGLSTKQMESIVKLNTSKIDYYIKEMCHKTNSHNRTELISKSKDAKVI
jgi:transcription elongation factor GreA-like protein